MSILGEGVVQVNPWISFTMPWDRTRKRTMGKARTLLQSAFRPEEPPRSDSGHSRPLRTEKAWFFALMAERARRCEKDCDVEGRPLIFLCQSPQGVHRFPPQFLAGLEQGGLVVAPEMAPASRADPAGPKPAEERFVGFWWAL